MNSDFWPTSASLFDNVLIHLNGGEVDDRTTYWGKSGIDNKWVLMSTNKQEVLTRILLEGDNVILFGEQRFEGPSRHYYLRMENGPLGVEVKLWDQRDKKWETICVVPVKFLEKAYRLFSGDPERKRTVPKPKVR